MSGGLNEGLYAYHAFTIALYGEREYCDPVVGLLRNDERLSESGVCCRRHAADFVRLVGRHQDIAAAVLVWSSADADGLLDLVARLRQQQVNPLMPILVRSLASLSAPTRQRLKANGIHGPYCREGLDTAALVDDLHYALDAMHEKQALVALSGFANEQAGVTALPELAAAALAFLHRNGMGALGGLFCLFRPTSQPEWLALAGTGRFGAADCVPLAELDAPVRALIEREGGGVGERCDADGVMLRFVTPDRSRVCIYLTQNTPFIPWHRIIARLFCNRLAIAVDEILIKRRLERMHHATIATLATLAEYKDVDTGNHVARVARITTEVTQVLADQGIVAAADIPLMRHIGHASTLHDIGKVGIPDKILLKPGQLDADERRIVQSHTALGHEILLKTAALSDAPELMRLAAAIARSHHERYDGKGYPDGLAGEAIPLAARIVAVVDVFDALTSARPYKEPWPEEQAIDFICGQAGFHFDPKIVEAFLTTMEHKKDAIVVVWTDDFSVGHAGIDEDHRKLFDILNQIWTAKEAGNRQVVEMALDDLMHYTMNHFRREEEYMGAIGYPDFPVHRAAHESFAQRIESLRWEYRHGLRKEIRIELLNYLSEWLMNHIAQADRAFSRFFGGLDAPPHSYGACAQV